ncbi:hypothetical protein Q75_15635 [Bacillus coahuilensis p1.1.43]|uniref:N-acetyltransferase domain-containing protein n=1 Tax=Bacillus coahuilensis p1.1.43 TaxID=1150625 RepID=A0A147K4S4_9BACI|nr:GNAT family N-acetyltransferase [Bacillus coahuilensis]KUP04421.1 hypothetical protein Q75_15635 [Bacillus coahuilensis p1.1.43]
MYIQFVEKVQDEMVRSSIWDILCECDNEFVPSLSSRESSLQNELNLGQGERPVNKPVSYFQEIQQQSFLLAFNQNKELVGFMTFITQHETDILQAYSPSNYITTVCVTASARNQGITRAFYHHILGENDLPEHMKMSYTTTRTWSTNHAHIHVLQSLGFTVVAHLHDHRGPGIDTLYFGKGTGSLSYGLDQGR